MSAEVRVNAAGHRVVSDATDGKAGAGTILDRMARRLAGLQWDEVPGDVAQKAVACVADALACALLGRDEEPTLAARSVVPSRDAGPATVWGTDRTTIPSEAAFMNSVASHALLFEDMDLPSASHPGTVVVPAALALAESRGRSGSDMLIGVVGGYEVMGHIGAAIHAVPAFRAREFRQSGLFGPLGAAAAAARIMGLAPEQAAWALAIAGNVGGGLRQWAHEGSSEVYFHNGFAAKNGVMAAELAEQGVSGARGFLDGAAGFNNAYADGQADLDGALESFGDDFVLRRIFFKPVPACQAVQTVRQVAEHLRLESDLRPEDVESVQVFTSKHGAFEPGMDFQGPFLTFRQAQLSNQFTVATVLVHGETGQAEYRRYDDPAVAELAGRVTVEVGDDIETRFPAEKGARLVVRLRDGRILEHEQADLVAPTPSDVLDKLEDAAGTVFGQARAEELRQTVAELPKLDDLTALSKLLTAN